MTTANVTNRLLALCLIISTLTLWPSVGSSALLDQRGFVAKTRTQALFVFGTTHMPKPENKAINAFALSPCFKSVAHEIDDSKKWGKALADGLPRPMLLAGKVLSKNEVVQISELLSTRFNRVVTLDEVATAPAAGLYYALLALPLAPSVFPPVIGFDLETSLSGIAQREGLRVSGISYGEDHAHALRSLKESDWNTLIKGIFSAISNADSDSQAWVKEINILEQLSFVGHFDAAYEFADKVQRSRFGNPFGASLHHLVHSNWVKRLKDLGDGSHLIVLGTNHLGGKTGIRNLLQQAGYEINNITLADANCIKNR